MKRCKKCDTEKPKTEFSRDKSSKDGLQSKCKACERAHYASNKEAISEQQRVYQAANKETIAEKKRAYNSMKKEDIAATCLAYRTENKEKIAAKHREYYAANKEVIAAKKRDRHAASPEKAAAISRRWLLENPDKAAANNRNRRARKRSANGRHTAEDVNAIFESQRGMCASCPAKLIKSGKNRYHVDHIVPLIRGGSNDKYNIQCLCPSCNMRKNAKDPMEWAKQNGRLL